MTYIHRYQGLLNICWSGRKEDVRRASLRVINGDIWLCYWNKKHLKNVEPIRHNEPPHAHSPDVASGTVARRLHIDVHDNDDNDNAWQRGPLWPDGMNPIKVSSGLSTFRLRDFRKHSFIGTHTPAHTHPLCPHTHTHTHTVSDTGWRLK